jgi:hypothetical protein
MHPENVASARPLIRSRQASRARPHPRAQRIRRARRRLSPRPRCRVERKRLFGDLETVLRLPETYEVRLRSPY